MFEIIDSKIGSKNEVRPRKKPESIFGQKTQGGCDKNPLFVVK